MSLNATSRRLEARMIDIDQIEISLDNPRLDLSKKGLDELVQSVRSEGVIEPIVVRKRGERYEIIAGERRARAAAYAGLTQIPAIIQDLDDEEVSRIRLIENLNREDLDIFERAVGVRAYMKKYGLSVEKVASLLHKKPQTINGWFVAAESASPKIKTSPKFRQLKPELLRELAKYDDETQERLAEAIIDYGLIVHQARQLIRSFEEDPSADVDKIAKRIKDQYETVTITVPKERAKQIVGRIEREQKQREKKREIAKESLKKHLRKTRETRSAESRIEPSGSKADSVKIPVSIPYGTRTLLESKIRQPDRRSLLARAIEQKDFDESKSRALIELAGKTPDASVDALVRIVDEEAERKGRVSFMVIEVKSKIKDAIGQEGEKRKKDPKVATVELVTERLSELGYET